MTALARTEYAAEGTRPAQVLFVTWDSDGADPSGLAAAAEVVAGGGQAVFLGHRRQRGVVEAAGFEFREFRLVRRRSTSAASRWTVSSIRRDLAVAMAGTDPTMVIFDEDLLSRAGLSLGCLLGADAPDTPDTPDSPDAPRTD